MEKMSRVIIDRVAKEIVHEALKQYPKAIPWFVGIYDDWTIGTFEYNFRTKHLTFSSDNFSERDLYDICRFISKKTEKEVNFYLIIHYTDFNDGAGRLVVKQLTEAVTDLIMDLPVKRNSSYDSYVLKEPPRLICGIPEQLYYAMKSGGVQGDAPDDEFDD